MQSSRLIASWNVLDTPRSDDDTGVPSQNRYVAFYHHPPLGSDQSLADPTSRPARFSTLRSLSRFKFGESTGLVTDTTATADYDRNAIPLRRYRDSVQPPIEEEHESWDAESRRNPFARDTRTVDSEMGSHPPARTWNAL